jgi:hypothetical protein
MNIFHNEKIYAQRGSNKSSLLSHLSSHYIFSRRSVLYPALAAYTLFSSSLCRGHSSASTFLCHFIPSVIIFYPLSLIFHLECECAFPTTTPSFIQVYPVYPSSLGYVQPHLLSQALPTMTEANAPPFGA